MLKRNVKKEKEAATIVIMGIPSEKTITMLEKSWRTYKED
jgi:hypothetical protein